MPDFTHEKETLPAFLPDILNLFTYFTQRFDAEIDTSASNTPTLIQNSAEVFVSLPN